MIEVSHFCASAPASQAVRLPVTYSALRYTHLWGLSRGQVLVAYRDNRWLETKQNPTVVVLHSLETWRL